jgi:hypothetical protein
MIPWSDDSVVSLAWCFLSSLCDTLRFERTKWSSSLVMDALELRRSIAHLFLSEKTEIASSLTCLGTKSVAGTILLTCSGPICFPMESSNRQNPSKTRCSSSRSHGLRLTAKSAIWPSIGLCSVHPAKIIRMVIGFGCNFSQSFYLLSAWQAGLSPPHAKHDRGRCRAVLEVESIVGRSLD